MIEDPFFNENDFKQNINNTLIIDSEVSDDSSEETSVSENMFEPEIIMPQQDEYLHKNASPLIEINEANEIVFEENIVTPDTSAPPMMHITSTQPEPAITHIPNLHSEPEGIPFLDGLYLKKIRLEIGISLQQITEKTNIGIHHLEAIESNNFKDLPAPVYVKSYVKQIAKILGLDSQKVGDAYIRLYNESCGN